MKTILTGFAFLIVTALPLAGCTNTVDGVGRDLERAGQTLQRSSQ